MLTRWCGTGWGGQPLDERPEVVASFGGDTFVEVDLHVGRDPDDEENEECPVR